MIANRQSLAKNRLLLVIEKSTINSIFDLLDDFPMLSSP